VERKEHTVKLTPGVGNWWVARLDLDRGGIEGHGSTAATALAHVAEALARRERR